jgi:antitoxin (DNA-binding transcriptional repressor) of toxin-antitoxin stability system
MKTIELTDATSPLASYVPAAHGEPLVIMEDGKPTAVILPLADTDLETISLGTNPDFIALIEQSRAQSPTQPSIPAAEMRRRILENP